MNTQVELFNTSLTLISIPLSAYPYFCQGIIRLALGTWKDELKKLKQQEDELKNGNGSWSSLQNSNLISNSNSNTPPSPAVSDAPIKRLSVPRVEDNSNVSTPITSSPQTKDIDELCELLEDFINISFTPIECSVICPTELVNLLFGNVLSTIGKTMQIQVLKDEYVALKVDSDGQDTGSSVLNISFPLSSVGIPIFFIATYFSDYVLVPVRERHRVIKTLESQNYIFSDISNSYISISEELKSPELKEYEENTNNSENFDQVSSLSSSSALTSKTLSLFQTYNVNPLVDDSIKLLLTGARAGVLSGGNREGNDVYLSIVRILISPPEFFSLTVISGSEISFLIDSETANLFPSHMLLGSPTDFVQPVSFDLRNLPEDSTGIVSGLASIFSDPTRQEDTVHMRYLSTALTSVVLISEDDFKSALETFNYKG